MGAARDFLSLLNHKGLPIFNPIHNNIIQHNGVNNRNNNNNYNISKCNHTSKQLYNAIMWIITIIDASPNSPIYNIKSEIEENPNDILPKIKGVNTIIHGIFKGVTLTEKISELRTNNDIRNDLCQFNLLIEEINNSTDKEGNPIISYF